MPGGSPGVRDDSWEATVAGIAPKSLDSKVSTQSCKVRPHRARGPSRLTLSLDTHSHAETLLSVTTVPTPWEAPSPCKLVLGQLGRTQGAARTILNGLPLAAWLCQGKSSGCWYPGGKALVPRWVGSMPEMCRSLELVPACGM